LLLICEHRKLIFKKNLCFLKMCDFQFKEVHEFSHACALKDWGQRFQKVIKKILVIKIIILFANEYQLLFKIHKHIPILIKWLLWVFGYLSTFTSCKPNSHSHVLSIIHSFQLLQTQLPFSFLSITCNK
jgi:hypothetical protein